MEEVTLQSLQESIRFLTNSMNAKHEESEEKSNNRFESLVNIFEGNRVRTEERFEDLYEVTEANRLRTEEELLKYNDS